MDSQGIRAHREWAGSSYTSEHGREIHSGEHKRGDQDRALDSDEFMAGMIRARPRNDDLWLVEQKVVALDNLYRTGLGWRERWHEVARHIVSLSPSLDEAL
jgi:hypothetical protein